MDDTNAQIQAATIRGIPMTAPIKVTVKINPTINKTSCIIPAPPPPAIIVPSPGKMIIFIISPTTAAALEPLDDFGLSVNPQWGQLFAERCICLPHPTQYFFCPYVISFSTNTDFLLTDAPH